jgi:IS4 transposase
MTVCSVVLIGYSLWLLSCWVFVNIAYLLFLDLYLEFFFLGLFSDIIVARQT